MVGAVVVAMGALAAATVGCSSDDCGALGACEGNNASSSGSTGDLPSSQDAGVDPNIDPLTGLPRSARFAFTAIATQPRVTLDTSLNVPIAIARSDGKAEDVIVTVRDLPAGVTVDPLTIRSTESAGVLVIRVASTAKQGPFELVLDGAGGTEKATTTLPMFARGKSGTIDPTFGDGGSRHVLVGANPTEASYLVRIDSANRIYLAGYCTPTPAQTCVARLSADGAIDTAYGGIAHPVAIRGLSPGVIDSQGRFMIGGYEGTPDKGRVLRFTAAGLEDTAYQPNVGALPIGAIALCPGDNAMYVGSNAADHSNIFYKRVTDTGAIDTAFGAGAAYTSWSELDVLSGISCDAQGTLRAVGQWASNASSQGVGIHGMTRTFAPEPLVGAKIWTRATLTWAGDIVRFPDGRIAAPFRTSLGPEIIMIAAAGTTLQTTFGVNGIAPVPFATTGGMTAARQTDDKLVIASFEPQIARLTAAGIPDVTFGTNGVTRVVAGLIALQSDNRIISLTYDGPTKSYVVTRVWD